MAGNATRLLIVALMLTVLVVVSPLHTWAVDLNSHTMILLTDNNGHNTYIKTIDINDTSGIVISTLEIPGEASNAFYITGFEEDGSSLEAYKYSYVELTALQNSQISIGVPVDSCIEGDREYIVTNNSILIIADADANSKSFLIPISAFQIKIGDNTVEPTAIAVDSNYIYIAYNSSSGPGILALDKGKPSQVAFAYTVSIAKIENLYIEDIAPPPNIDMPVSTAVAVAGIYYNSSIDGYNPFYALIGSDGSIGWSVSVKKIKADTSFPVSITYSPQTNTYIATAVGVVEGVLLTEKGSSSEQGYIAEIDPQGGISWERTYYIDEGVYKFPLYIVKAMHADNGKIYAAGLHEGINDANVTILELDKTGSPLKAWMLSGGEMEYLNSSSLFTLGSYLWVAGDTESYGVQGVRSSFIAMMSPALENGDSYDWNVKPSYSNPTNPYVILPEDIKSGSFTLASSNTLRFYTSDETSSTSIASAKVTYESVDTGPLSTYKAYADKAPQPIPEPWVTALLTLAAAASIILLYRRSIRLS